MYLADALGGKLLCADRCSQPFSLGILDLPSPSGPASVRDLRTATVQLMAAKCFGTDDPSGTDEPYLIASIVSFDPFQLRTGAGAVTTRTEIVNDINGGNIFLKDGRLLTPSPINVTGMGLHIAVSMFDHDLGDPDKIRDTIQNAVEGAVNKGVQAIVGAASTGDPKLNGPVGDIFEFEVGGFKPFKLLSLGLSDLLAEAFGDDLVGSHVFSLTEGDLLNLELDPHMRKTGDIAQQYNVPTLVQDQDPDTLLHSSNSAGSYKVFLTVRVLATQVPVDPPIAVP
jgi:hypothetical protein